MSLKFRVVAQPGPAIEQSLKTDSTSLASTSGRERLSLYQALSMGAEVPNVSPIGYASRFK
jgi:hypothetical protein